MDIRVLYKRVLASKQVMAVVVVAMFSIGGAVYLGASHAATTVSKMTLPPSQMTPGASIGRNTPYTLQESLDTSGQVSSGTTVYQLPASSKSGSTPLCNNPYLPPVSAVSTCPSNPNARIDTGTFMSYHCYILKLISSINRGNVYMWSSINGCNVSPFNLPSNKQTWVTATFHVSLNTQLVYRICALVRRDKTAGGETMIIQVQVPGQLSNKLTVHGSTAYSYVCGRASIVYPKPTNPSSLDMPVKIINDNAAHVLRVASITLEERITVPPTNITNVPSNSANAPQ